MKKISLLLCFVALMLGASITPAMAQRAGGHSMGGRAGVGPSGMGGRGGGSWGGRNWGGDWRHRHRHGDFDDFFFVGFPFFGFGYPWGYPYGYDPYGYYGYGAGYGGYGQGYYDAGYYGGGYGPGYGYGYGDYGNSRSRVAQLQQRLARAGYYHGAIDGVMGPRTRSALRAYERDHRMANY
jgi:hypothetical protein